MRASVAGNWFWAVALVAAATGVATAAPANVSLVEAVRSGDEAAVRALLTSRQNINVPEPDGTTALHWAASRDRTAIVAMLIKAGADVKVANRYGVTPLLLACETGSPALVSALLAAGADPNNTMPEGETAVMVAARSDPAVEALPATASDEERALVFAKAIARRAVTEWEGVGDADGNPVPVTLAGIDALLEVWPIFEAFQAGYVAKGLLLDAEKNGSAPSLTGTSAGATATARHAGKRARTARLG